MTAAGLPGSGVATRSAYDSGVGKSIGAALRGQHNSLGVIRLILASSVIVSHAFPLGGFGADPFLRYTDGQVSLGGIAVGGFFVISGYLIVKSGAGSDILQFMWRRVIRIFPAFWAVLLFTAFVVGPIAWMVRGETLSSYFTFGPGGPFSYMASNWTLSIGAYGIHDIFIGTPYGELTGTSVFNGSLWTLAYEWGCYLLVGVLAVFGVLARARIMVPILTAFLLVAQSLALLGVADMGALLPMLGDPQVLFLGSTFLVGASIGIYSDKVPYDDRLGMLSILVFGGSLFYGGFMIFGVVAGGYFVMYLAARLPTALQWIGAKNDYSYGMYVYGFVVQQCLAALGVYRWGYWPFMLVALPLTFVLAWLSWHVVEKQALSLKSWGPGRGTSFWWHKLQGPWNVDLRRRSKQGVFDAP